MEASELRRLLNEGIQAAKANDRPLARERLLLVLEADGASEPAWLWLSAVVDDPHDQLMALEHVLAINPHHAQALAGAQALRQRLGKVEAAPAQAASEPMPAPEPALAVAAAVAPIQAGAEADASPAPVAQTILPAEAARATFDTVSFEDDPYQCAYCGWQTHPDDERCPHCGRGLLVAGHWRGGGYLYCALLATGIQLQLALVQALVAYIVSNYPQAMSLFPLASLWISPFLVPAVVRTVAWAVVLALLLGDYEGGFGVAAIVAVVDLAWAGIGYKLGFLAVAQTEANMALGMILLLIGLLAVISQAQARQRLRVVPDRNLEGALMFHQHALSYARQGKWALAALHWRRAISRAPREPLYYKGLGRANVALGRYAEAVRIFRSGAETAPDDQEFNRLIERVRAHARSS